MDTRVIGFDFPSRTRLVFGVDAVDQIGDLAKQLGGNNALLVTDPGIVGVGHAERVRVALDAAGIHVTEYTRVQENPTTRDVDHCLAVAQTENIDIIIGLGGGSSMDTAKGVNFLLTNGGNMKDYWGVGKATKPMLPLIAVPTTAGTGSECQSFALIADATTHKKMACGDPKAAPAISILDPTLTLTQPRLVTADTGVDALTHALETAVTTKRNEVSALFSREAYKLIAVNLPRVLNDPADVDARGLMQLGAAYAGMAIENSMLGAAHSAANPLTAHYNVIHGQAVGVMMPHVMRFNTLDTRARHAYEDLARASRLVDNGADTHEAVEAIIAHIEVLLNHAGIPRSIRECDVQEDMISQLASEAASEWTASFNPRKIDVHDFEQLYHAALIERNETVVIS